MRLLCVFAALRDTTHGISITRSDKVAALFTATAKESRDTRHCDDALGKARFNFR